MVIKKNIIAQINNVASRKRICDDLAIGDQMLYKHINANSNNGRLTKLDALMAISKETSESIEALWEELECSTVSKEGEDNTDKPLVQYP